MQSYNDSSFFFINKMKTSAEDEEDLIKFLIKLLLIYLHNICNSLTERLNSNLKLNLLFLMFIS